MGSGAEVLYSERPADDATHIAQVVGRMVRQPLAHRVATDDGLRSLDLQSPSVRDAIRAFDGAEIASLYAADCSTPFS